ncbi:MAG: TolC family protein [Bacteroides sp.]
MNRFWRLLSLFYVLLFGFLPLLWAQRERRELSLEECITYAREYSASALIARQSFLSSYWRYRSYRAEFLPALRFEGQLPSFNRKLQRYQLSDGSYKYLRENSNTIAGALSLNQSIGFTGTKFFLRTNAERHDLFGERRSTDYMTLPVQIGIEHRFFGVNSLKWKRKIEPQRYEQAKRVYLQTLESITQEATTLFFNLLIAKQQLQISRLNRANADTLYRIAVGRFNIGTIAENDLLQMELNLLNETNSESENEVNLQHATFKLVTFLGLNDSYDWELIPPTPYNGDTLSFMRVLEVARRNNPTPLQLKIQNIEAEQAIAEARSQRGFQLDLNASYGLTQQANELLKAYKSPLDQQGVALKVVIPILDWGQGVGRLKIARSNLKLTQVRTQKTLHEFEQEVFVEVMRYNRQPSLLRVAAKADTISQNRYEIAKQRFLIGKISVLDLDKAQSDRDAAKTSYLQAVRSSWTTYYQLRALMLVDPLTNEPLNFDFELLLK